MEPAHAAGGHPAPGGGATNGGPDRGYDGRRDRSRSPRGRRSPSPRGGRDGRRSSRSPPRRGGGRSPSRSRSRSRSRDRRRARSDSRDRDRRRSRSRSRERGRSPSPPRGPPPPRQRPERKRRAPSQWDVKPAGYVEGSGMADVLSADVLGGAGGVHGLAPGGAPSQQTRHARRLYVGGLGDALEREVEEYFSRIVKAAVTDPTSAASRLPNPVLSVYLNPERKFAFVEFCSIELANALVELGEQGLQFRGSMTLKLRRPDDYKPEVLPPEIRHKKEPLDLTKLPLASARLVMTTGDAGGMLLAATGGAAGAGQMMPVAAGGVMLWKIYIGNLPPHLADAQLHELVSAFGPVKKLDVPKNPDTGLPKGYAFLEYVDPSPDLVDRAIAGLDGLQVGDKRLQASRAKASIPTTASTLGIPLSAMGKAAAPSGMMPMQMMPAASSLPPAPMIPGPPHSRIALLEEMVSVEEDLATEQARAALITDVIGECVKYGALKDIVVPARGQAGQGRVFLEYADNASAQTALRALIGRQFAGRIIRGRFYDEEAYNAKHFTA